MTSRSCGQIGFTPLVKTRNVSPGVEFGGVWHTDPAYRADSVIAMAKETQRRFGKRARIGVLQDPELPTDFITGVSGALIVPALYGAPMGGQARDRPWTRHGQHLSDAQVDALEPPDLENNPFWQSFMEQVAWIARHSPWLDGFINWQSVINSGYRLRGGPIFTDMVENPERVFHLFDCLAATMIDGVKRLYAVQAADGVHLEHLHCEQLSGQYAVAVLLCAMCCPMTGCWPKSSLCWGFHNCAWNADPYVPYYASLPNVAYVDMGLDSNLAAAKAALPPTDCGVC